MKEYEFLIKGKMQFLVIKRWIDKKGKNRRIEHFVKLNQKGWHCDCKGFRFSKDKENKPCHHIRFIKSQLRTKEWGILRYSSELDEYVREDKKHLVREEFDGLRTNG